MIISGVLSNIIILRGGRRNIIIIKGVRQEEYYNNQGCQAGGII